MESHSQSLDKWILYKNLAKDVLKSKYVLAAAPCLCIYTQLTNIVNFYCAVCCREGSAQGAKKEDKSVTNMNKRCREPGKERENG